MIYDTDDYDDVVHVDIVGKRKVYTEATYNKLLVKHHRLRGVLEKIAAMPLSASWQQHFYDAVKMAQEALQEDRDE